ncbi:hypothetical protein J7M22_12545 [Candidatus Poribacteria bacterium]|nr:hypothetical protein [Candidatus Poribacteria bacterium]
MKLIRPFKTPHFILLIPLLISISLRLQSLPSLEERFFIGTDPYRFFRQAQIILQNGKLPLIDRMRWIPPGRDLSKHLNLSSYFIAYLHRIVRSFFPSISLHTTASIYPIVCFSIFLLLFFLFVREIFGFKLALLSTFFSSISPFLLPRSMAGFPDRDSLCLALSAGSSLLFAKSALSSGLRKQLLALGAGLSQMALVLSWEGSGLFSGIIILLMILKMMFDEFKTDDFLATLSYLTPPLTAAFILTKTYICLKPFALLAWGVPTWFLITATIYIALRRIERGKIKLFSVHLSLGASSLLVIILALVLYLISPSSTSWRLFSIWDNFISPLGGSRLMRTVSELYRPTAIDWVSWYGISFLLISTGSMILLYRVSKEINLNPWLSLSIWEIFLIGLLYSRFPLIPERISQMMYISSILLLVGYVLMVSPRKPTGGRIIPLLFPLCWFSVMLMVARGAQRYHFFLAPPTLILTGLAFQEGFRAALRLRLLPLKASSLTLLTLILGHFVLSYCRADFRVIRSSRPMLSRPWREAMEWMRDNLPNDAVVAAWWHYGSMINVLAHKGTVVDEDHFIPYRIHLMSRHLFCAQSEREALEFLKAHRATHIAISLSDLLSLPMISWLASDERGDKRVMVVPLISPDGMIPIGKGKWIVNMRPPGGIPGDSPLTLKDETIPKGKWGLSGFYLLEEGDEVVRGIGVVETEHKMYKLPIKVIYLSGSSVEGKERGEIPGYLAILSKGNIWRGVYLSEKAGDYLVAKLLLRGKLHHFRRVYPRDNTAGSVPEVQVWEISYPEGLSYPEAYLEREFPDAKLYRAWVRGR